MPNAAECCRGLLGTCHAWITDHSQAFLASECLPISSAMGREAMYTEAKTVNSVCGKRWIKSPVYFSVFTAHE